MRDEFEERSRGMEQGTQGTAGSFTESKEGEAKLRSQGTIL